MTETKSLLPPHIYNPPKDPLDIIHKDDDLLVLNKPSGLLSVPGRAADHHDCLENRAKDAFPEALLTHRLDCDTSGIMIMAMNKRAQSLIGKHFERRLISKTYIARVWGHVEGDEGMIDLPLRCDWPKRPLQMVCFEHGRASQTGWKVLARETENGIKTTLMELSPITGRSHQLRVHMRELGKTKQDDYNKNEGGHPILGDDLYAHEDAFRCAPRLMLHAQSLTLHHPKDGERVTFESAAPF